MIMNVYAFALNCNKFNSIVIYSQSITIKVIYSQSITIKVMP